MESLSIPFLGTAFLLVLIMLGEHNSLVARLLCTMGLHVWPERSMSNRRRVCTRCDKSEQAQSPRPASLGLALKVCGDAATQTKFQSRSHPDRARKRTARPGRKFASRTHGASGAFDCGDRDVDVFGPGKTKAEVMIPPGTPASLIVSRKPRTSNCPGPLTPGPLFRCENTLSRRTPNDKTRRRDRDRPRKERRDSVRAS